MITVSTIVKRSMDVSIQHMWLCPSIYLCTWLKRQSQGQKQSSNYLNSLLAWSIMLISGPELKITHSCAVFFMIHISLLRSQCCNQSLKPLKHSKSPQRPLSTFTNKSFIYTVIRKLSSTRNCSKNRIKAWPTFQRSKRKRFPRRCWRSLIRKSGWKRLKRSMQWSKESR